MVTDYLDALYRDAYDGYLVISFNNFMSNRSFPISQIKEASDFMLAQAKGGDTYFGFGLLKTPPTSGRGKSVDVCASGGLFMDLDLKSSELGVHSKNELPETVEEALSFLKDTGVPEPTAIRHSGNGLYADWFFDQVQVFGTDEDREALQSLSKRLQRLIIHIAKKIHGWTFDNTADLTRVTRMPGTLNHKTNPPKPVKLISIDENRRYTVEQLLAAVAELERKHGLVRSASKPGVKKHQAPANDNDASEEACSWEAVQAGCDWARWCLDSSSQLPEPDWYALASVASRCSNGEAIFHELSKADLRYNEAETDAKLKHATEAAGPRTCDNIANELGYEGCKTCPFSGRISSPISLGRAKPEVVGLMRQHAFDIKTGRYFDLADGHVLTDKAFTQKYRHLTHTSTPHALLIGSRFTRKVDRVDYLPGNKLLFPVNEDGHEVLNLWRQGPLEPTAGDCTIIMDHLAFILPVEAELNHFLDCLAHAVQRPAVKVRHVLLIIGFQGIGKSIIARLIKLLFGRDNVMIAENHDLNDGWTEALGNKQILFLEELGISEKRETYESLKRWVTDEQVRVNEKQVPKHWARTPRLMLAFSNSEVPTALQEGDRRFWVSRSPARPKGPEYYNRFVDEGLSQAPAFLHFLVNRDLTSFNAAAAPPMTTAKENILEWSRPAVEQEIEFMIDQRLFPFTRELFTTDEVRHELTRRVHRCPTPREVGSALKGVGAQQLKQTRIGNGERVRAWVLNDIEKWKDATPEDIKAQFPPDRDLGASA